MGFRPQADRSPVLIARHRPMDTTLFQRCLVLARTAHLLARLSLAPFAARPSSIRMPLDGGQKVALTCVLTPPSTHPRLLIASHIASYALAFGLVAPNSGKMPLLVTDDGQPLPSRPSVTGPWIVPTDSGEHFVSPAIPVCPLRRSRPRSGQPIRRPHQNPGVLAGHSEATQTPPFRRSPTELSAWSTLPCSTLSGPG